MARILFFMGLVNWYESKNQKYKKTHVSPVFFSYFYYLVKTILIINYSSK